MKAGTRVKIAGVKKRPELNGREGVALYYVPADNAQSQNRYVVKVDGSDDKLRIKLDNLRPCEREEELHEDTVCVNGLVYCEPHRMEICGACSFDFRVMNRMAMLEPGDDVYNRATRLDEDEAARNEPPLRAPPKGSAAPTPHPSAAAVNSKALPARGLDPSTLDAWPHGLKDKGTGRGALEQAFNNAFSMREILMSHTPNGAPSPADAPLYHVKQSILAMGKRVEACFKEKKPTPRFSLQDEAETEVLFIDVVDVRTLAHETDDRGKEYPIPGLVVRYGYYTTGNMRNFVSKVGAAMEMKREFDLERGFGRRAADQAGFQNMPSHLAEIATARALLDAGRKRLDADFVKRAERGLVEDWRVSLLQPVSKDAEQPPKQKEVCAKCGRPGKRLLTCARCKTRKYCSKECQTADWKEHKQTCAPPEEDAAADIIAVDVNVDVYSEFAGPGMSFAVWNADASLSSDRGASKGSSTTVHRDMASRNANLPSENKLFVVKIQVPLEPGALGSQVTDAFKVAMGMRERMQPSTLPADIGMMCYNQKRNLTMQITPSNCADAARLDRAVRTGGVAGGVKGYYNAYLADGKLNILAHKPLPLQPW